MSNRQTVFLASHCVNNTEVVSYNKNLMLWNYNTAKYLNVRYSFLILVCFPDLARSTNISFIFAVILCSKRWVIIKWNFFKQKNSLIRYLKKNYVRPCSKKSCCLFFTPLSDIPKSKGNFIVHRSGPGIFTIAFRQPKYKSFWSFLPKHSKIIPSSGIRLKRQKCLDIL